MTELANFIPYLLIGLGFGYLVSLGVTGGPTSLDRKKEELEAKKEWLRMQGAKNVRK